MTMKQRITNFSGLASLKQEAVPLPEPQKEEVLVKISAVSLNFEMLKVNTELLSGLLYYVASRLAY